MNGGALDHLADQITDLNEQAVELRSGTIASHQAGSLTLHLGGGTVDIPEPGYLTSDFAAGDRVQVLKAGHAVTILGSPDGSEAPAARVYRSGGTSIPNGAWTTVNFDAELFDPDQMHINIDPYRPFLIAPSPGYYRVSAGIYWDANATGVRDVAIYSGGTAFARSRDASTTAATRHQSVTTLVGPLDAGNSIYVRVYQNRGGTLYIAGGHESYLDGEKVRGL